MKKGIEHSDFHINIQDMVSRGYFKEKVSMALGRSRVVALLGPRQSGKTTIAREFVSPESLNYFDCEHPLSSARLDQPMIILHSQGLERSGGCSGAVFDFGFGFA